MRARFEALFMGVLTADSNLGSIFLYPNLWIRTICRCIQIDFDFCSLFTGSRPQSSEGDQGHHAANEKQQKLMLLDPMAINMIPPELEESSASGNLTISNEENVTSLEERLSSMRMMENSALYGPRGSLV